MHNTPLLLIASLTVCALTPMSTAAWNVSAPPGPKAAAMVDTDEGTWMNLDVSPDGQSVVFDLLGDIFTLSMKGGEARPLVSGLAFESQPRFSPDGRSIAFISDRAGVDNVWTMDVDGANQKQVTDERDHPLSAPAWSPDGRFIVVRKHYTATRSIGAGEIWMYPLSGGHGAPLVESESTQKDINEPMYSPDGATLYFSRESWPGAEFQYNKDVHQGIYQIHALDLKRGGKRTVVAGPGGAVRPTPSPDGRWLAYVKRNGVSADGLSSALVVREVASGRQRVLYDHLDQDAQEVWANYGIYPAFDWTPDSQALVFWAGGKLRRVALSGSNTLIRFRVKQSFDYIEPPRTAVPVAPDEFRVRMLRWVTVSPNGKLVAYQALGHIYVRDLVEGGAVRRLTKQSEHFEFYPTWSPDGEWIVYSTWNDRSLGQIQRTHVRSGRTQTITTRPGHYLESAVSPDGRKVVYRSGQAGKLLDPAWTNEPAIHEAPWSGEQPSRTLTTDGVRPQFCGTDPRLFVTRLKEHAEKPPAGLWADIDRTLVSLDADSVDPYALAVSGFATEYRVSPDCRWLARVEMGEVFVTPLVTAGRPVRLGLESDGLPQFHAPGDGGEYLSWSQDGALHWALGPDLYTWTFGADGPVGEVRKRTIGFLTSHHKPQGVVALTGGRLITMRGDEVIENGTVVIEGNRIAAIGPVGKVNVPPKARVVELGGRTVIPGLIDSHAHGPQAEEGLTPQQNWAHFAGLALGVTTIFDPAPVSSELFAAAELRRVGAITAPRIFGTGTILYGPRRDYTAVIENYEDALKQLRRRQAVGATSVKSYLHPRREQRQMIVAAARELGMMVNAEQSMGTINVMAQVADGTTSIEHNFPAVNVYGDVLQFWGQTGVDNVPTLVVQLNGLFGDNYWYGKTDVWRHPLLSRYVPPDLLRAQSIRGVRAPPEDISALSSARAAERLRRAGVRIGAGAHGEREGLALHWEMWLLSEGGMAPMDVLRTATIQGAQHLGMAADLGSLEPGKLADLVVLEANPLTDLLRSDQVRYVVANGVVFDATSMNVVNGPSRQPFYWEAADSAYKSAQGKATQR